MTTKVAVRPLSLRGVWGHAPQKNLKSRSSEMLFPAFWASKSVLLMGIFIDHKTGFFLTRVFSFLALGLFCPLFCSILKISVVVVVVVFAFFLNIIFIFINEIQTDGSKRSYRQW